jgi:hypothetical protein
MKKTIWRPLVLGVVFGFLAGLATVTGFSFLTPGITDNAIGFYGTFLLLAAALGGPLAGAIASVLLVIISALFGPIEMKEIVTIPAVFWSNLLALIIPLILVGFAYRLIYERLKMPGRLLAWAGIVIMYYLIINPASIIPQYYLLGDSTSEILPAVLGAYKTYIPQAIFDTFFTSLVFIALPRRYRRPLWYESKKASGLNSEFSDDEIKGAL